MSKKKQSSEPSQIASSSANTKTSGSNEVDRQLAQQPSRTEPSQLASSPASTATAQPCFCDTVHVSIDGSCLNQRSKVKKPRTGLGVRFPQSDYRDVSENVFGAPTNNRAEATACLRVLQHVHRSGDVHVHTLMWNPKLLYFSVYYRRPVGGLNCVRLASFCASPLGSLSLLPGSLRAWP